MELMKETLSENSEALIFKAQKQINQQSVKLQNHGKNYFLKIKLYILEINNIFFEHNFM